MQERPGPEREIGPLAPEDFELLRNRILENILIELRTGGLGGFGGLRAAGYTKSEGKNYGKYEKA